MLNLVLNPHYWNSYLALVGALAAEADYVFIPEWPAEVDWQNKLCNKLTQAMTTSTFIIHFPVYICAL